MAISRSNPTILFVLLSLACAPRDTAPALSAVEGPGSPAAVEVAAIQKIQIEHVTPRRDFVGPRPTTLEWTAVDGVDSYEISVENDIELPVFDQEGIKSTSVPWPKDIRIDPGTYFWRIVGIKGDKIIADSGRAAFVVME